MFIFIYVVCTLIIASHFIYVTLHFDDYQNSFPYFFDSGKRKGNARVKFCCLPLGNQDNW